ncbi:MAG: nucleotide sugar dehydrogenase [Balneolales bacterium]
MKCKYETENYKPYQKPKLQSWHHRAGYVGLPLLWTFHEKGFPVMGFDIDQSKIDAINSGKTYIKHFGDENIQKLAASDRCDLSTDFSDVSKVDAVLICVPTPLSKYREPDVSYVEGTVRSMASHIKKGQLIVLESTTYPDTTEELIKPICEELNGMKAGEDFFLAYSPEREDPGNASFNTATIPKVVGADGEDAKAIAMAIYSGVISQAVPVSDTKTAEAVKLLENIFRSVNIALVNELKVVFEQMDIDIYEVIYAAKTKPFGFMPLPEHPLHRTGRGDKHRHAQVRAAAHPGSPERPRESPEQFKGAVRRAGL